MKFLVSRTSQSFSSESAPCAEAKKGAIVRAQVRTLTEEEYQKKFAYAEGDWRKKGTFGHSITAKGYILRYQKGEDWLVEIRGLPSLLRFIIDHDSEVVINCSGGAETPELEIYDDYRE